MGKSKKTAYDRLLRDALAASRVEYYKSSAERRLARAASGSKPPRPSSYKTFEAIEGGTLNRFVKKADGTTLSKEADQTDRDNQCTGCALPHDPLNAACWGASKAGKPPPALKGLPGQLYDVVTGKFIGKFTFTSTRAWPRSRFVKGKLKVTRVKN